MSKCPCGFCHLHVHSEYSLLDGANRVKDLAKRAAEMDMPALALTDHGVMYGAIDFYEACKAQGIKPILGCCLPGQLIYTAQGVKPIENIEVGDMVLTHRGRFRPVVRTMTRAFDGTIYGVRAANSNVVWLTDEHPVLVSDRKQEKLDWVRADELSARAGRAAMGRRGGTNWKSFAVFPRLRHEKMRLTTEVSLLDALDATQYGERDGQIFKCKCFNKYDREIAFDLPVRVLATPQLADLLGLFVAEGSFMRDKLGRATSITWSFGLKRDRALAQRVVETLRDIFGLKCDWREREDKALLEVLCHSTVLARVLEAWCGSGAHNKKIPAFVFGWNDENIAAFLNGLADGDAKIDPRTGRVVLKMVARDVIYGARLLLARLGMTGKAALFENAGHRAYMLTWSPNAAYRRHGIDDSYLYLPLKEVTEKHYVGPVYNFEVAEDNSYVTDFVLHNCEAYVAPRKHTDKDPHLDKQKNTHHLTLWAKNLQGYKNLVKLTTRAHLDGFYYRPRIDHELIAQHSEGIICGSACLGGEIPQLIAGNKFDEAVARAEKYREIFGKENFFLEMMDHDLHGQDEVNEKLISIHHKTGIPLIVSNDAHYLRAQDEEMHKILVAIGTNSTVQNATFNYGPNFYLKSADEMYARFKHIPEALDNTMRIAEMVDLELDLKSTHFPNFDVPPGHDLESYFRLLCEQRFDKRYPPGHPRRQEASTRIKYEQQIIIDKGYPGYFLVVQDLINWSKDRGILVGCRGSAAGCLVSYVLGITNLDPLPYGLLFERFLNPDRVSTPDIDIDFPDKRRDEVMQYVSNKYGKDKVAQIITFGTLAARAAIRDTARATGLDLKIADNVAKLIPAIPGHPITIMQAIEQVKELGDLYASDSTVRGLCDSATQIEGMTRHASRHACGVVIGKDALDELVPLEEKDGDIITQYHAKAVEKIGLVKMDFLGLQNNTVINDTLELIESRHGVKIDLENIELDDKKVYDMLGRGDGIAVFQMEGTGMRGLLREMKPENLEHIIAQISLYRPGPMDEIPKYISGRHGGKVTYPHPKLEGVLKDTYGMLLYQEQVMQASQVLAGFTGGQSETLMKAMSKKKADDMAKMKPLFLEGCAKNGVSQNDANDIFGRMEEFAKYAFNKSHAAYYALVSYWTAFLKVNYPSEFLACKMTSLLEKKDKLLIIIDDCRKHGIEVLPADVNESNHEFTVVEGGIRFGLQAIKGIGEAPVNAICEARKEGGKFSSLFDFCARVSSRACGKGAIETLVKCGAFDSLHSNRQAMCEAIEGAISAGLQAQQDAASGQVNMFGDATEMGRPKASGTLPNVPDADRDVRLAWEKEYLGLYISDHPLLPLRGYLESEGITQLGTASENPNLRDGSKVKVAGLVTTVKKMVDKNGRTWAAFTLEDLTGSMEILAFSKSYEKCGACVEEDAKLVVSGRLTADNRRGKGFGGGGGEDDDNGAPDAESIQYKIMADNIEVIDLKKAGAVPASDDSTTSSTRSTPLAYANTDAAANGTNGNSNGGANGNGAPVGGMSIGRQTIGGNGSAPIDYSNGNGANGNGHSNGHSTNGNGHANNYDNGNGASNGSANVNGDSNGSAAGEGSWHDEPLKIGRAFAPPVSASGCVHLYVAEDKADADTLMRLWNICRQHPGTTEVWLHLDNGLEMVQLRASHAFWVDGSQEFCQEVLQVLGDGCVLAPC